MTMESRIDTTPGPVAAGPGPIENGKARPKMHVASETIDAMAFSAAFDAIVENIETVIKGKNDVVRLALVAILCEGHILFEDLPGTGKSMLARAIAQSMNATSNRVQCTPDMLPGDITGSSILDQKQGTFEFRPGPIFTNVLLSDEINRATPKTQSALLEAMAERRVSADGITYDLPRPVPRARHPEPGRAGRHVPAARGPARPLPVQAVDGLHEPRHRVRGHVRQLGRSCRSRTSARSSTPTRSRR